MKQFNYRHSIVLVAILFIAASLFYGEAQSPSTSAANKAKADYLYLEAQRYNALDSIDAYYELMSEAARLNPSDLYIANEIGYFNIAINQTDSTIVEENLRKMIAYIETNPSDELATARIVRICSSLGHTDKALYVLRLAYENSKNIIGVGSAYAKALATTSNTDSIKKALDIMLTVEKNTDVTLNTTIAKMNMYLILGDTASVINAGHKLLSESPKNIEYLTFFGNIHMQMNQLDSAFVYYNRAVDTDPTSGLAYYSRAQYYKQLGDSANYDREVFQALRHPDLDIEPKVEILRTYVSELYTDSTQTDRIKEMFVSLTEQYPHEEDVRSFYGSYLWIIKDLAGAAEQFSYMLDINPNNKDSWVTLAQIHYNLDDYKAAKSTCLSALNYFPDDYTIYSLIANMAMFKEQYDDCSEYIQKSLAVADTTNAEQLSDIYGVMADLEYRKGNFKQMETYYQKAIELNPNNSMFYNNYAYYLACENIELEKALKYINYALSLELEEDDGKNSATTLDTYAWVLFKNKDYEKALEAIDAVLDLEKENPSAEILHHAGDIYFMNGMPDEALDFWESALEEDPDDELLQRKVKHKTFFFE